MTTTTQHRHRQLCSGAAIVLTAAVPAWAQQGYTPVEESPPKLCVSEQVIYQSNLFHLSDSADVQQRLGPDASRSDTILQTSACANADWHPGQQQIALNLTIDDNRYRNNRMLDHTSGLGKLQWDWRTAGDWYGKLGGSYRQSLGSFLNDRPLVKDLVESEQYFGELNHDFGAYVKINLGGSRTDTSHKATERQVDNYRSTSGDAGITLTSRAENYLGANFKRTRANYPYDVVIATETVTETVDRDYQEDTTSLRFRYALASKTVLRGSAGYLQREYLRASDNGYSGSVWRVGLNWQPTSQTQLDFAAWKELSAYFDSESDHFVSRGGSITPSWAPRNKLKFSALASWAQQEYLARSLAVLETAPRKDDVLVAGIDILYQPLDFLDFNIRHSHERHDSNLPVYDYVDRVTSLRIRARF